MRTFNESTSRFKDELSSLWSNFPRQAYELLAERDVKHAFEKCLDKHLNDGNARIIWAREEQTKAKFCKSLEDIMTPVYQSAKRSGFGTISMF